MCISCRTPAALSAASKAGHIAGRERVRLHEARAVEHVGEQLALVERRLQRAAVVVVAGIAADRGEPVELKTLASDPASTANLAAYKTGFNATSMDLASTPQKV
jgi:hypothetical protein